MNKKKQTQPSTSQGESEQAQFMFTRYHQIATQLRGCNDEQQVEAALAEINNMPAGAQIAFLKALAREQQVDAADVLAALHTFGTLKDARKEARRSLIRLEGAKIYPGWEAPLVSPLEDSSFQTTTFPPRFFKGLVTDSFGTGEVQLILCWEIGEDYREVRMLGFLLEFWHDGIKDFFTSSETKRSFANILTQMTARLDDVKLKECSLTEGIGWLEEAKAVNARYGTKPHRDYTTHRALINQLIPESLALQIASEVNMRNQDEDEDEDEIDLSDLDPEAIVTSFVEAWVDGDLGIAHQVLAQDSPLHEGLSREAWIKRRENWAERFVPTELQPGLLHTREPQKSKIWLPASLSKKDSQTTKEVEVGWSIELEEALRDADNTLPEVPTPVLRYNGTNRHWFWASFTLVQENNAWHIQSMTDEYLKTRELSVEAIKKRIDELDQKAEKTARRQNPATIAQMNEVEQEQFLAGTLLPILQTLYYVDILVQKEPLDRSLYIDAAGRAMILGQYERSLAHLQAVLERFPEEHAQIHRRIGELEQRLAAKYADDYDDDDTTGFYLNLAEESFSASLDLEEDVETRISLAEILLEQDDRLDEAKSQLLQAKNAANGPDEEAHIGMHLGEIALKQGQLEVGLSHFQRVVELRPADADGWEALGSIQQDLEQFEEAESSYKRAIELDPHDPALYSTLALLYKDQRQEQRAIQELKDGLVANPESLELHLYLVGTYTSMDNFQQAEDFLEKAERLDPGSELVASYRQMIALSKQSRPIAAQKPLRLTGPKKKKHHH